MGHDVGQCYRVTSRGGWSQGRFSIGIVKIKVVPFSVFIFILPWCFSNRFFMVFKPLPNFCSLSKSIPTPLSLIVTITLLPDISKDKEASDARECLTMLFRASLIQRRRLRLNSPGSNTSGIEAVGRKLNAMVVSSKKATA